MPELRRDPVHGHWTIVAADRGRRPFEPPPPDPPADLTAGDCPLCPGREDRTPPEILAVDGAGRPAGRAAWAVRVIPNMYPALGPDSGTGAADGDLFRHRPGYGAHELVVESAQHDRGLGALPAGQAVRVLEVCRERIRALAADPRIEYVLLFKNRGRGAGASLSHPHLQILATPAVPDAVAREREAALRHREKTGSCLLCDIVRRESAAGVRTVLDNGEFVALTPYAPRLPFETMILPRRHRESFVESEPAEMRALAGLLQDLLARMDETLDRPPYNLVLHTSQCRTGAAAAAGGDHWHIEILPRLIRLGGFEWGAGIHIIPVSPEEAARRLRFVPGPDGGPGLPLPPAHGRDA